MMGTDGIVDEAALLNGLGFLHQRQVDALGAGEKGTSKLVDIVCLSLGYYHESDLDGVTYDSRLKKALDALADVGVMVVAAAGNNATSRPLLPAAFAPSGRRASPDRDEGAAGQRGRLANPDGSVALFSNDGTWTPATPRAPPWSAPCRRSTSGCDHRSTWRRAAPRASGGQPGQLDPDKLTGFGTWSGTSFAALVMAAPLPRRCSSTRLRRPESHDLAPPP